MPASLLLLLPYLLAAVAALILAGPQLRPGVIGVVLVTLATAAESRVGAGTPSFRVINAALLYGGLVLFAVAVAMNLKGSRSAMPSPVPAHGPSSPATSILRRWGMPVLLALLLIPSLWFVLTVAGPEAWTIEGLREAPFSPAGEILLASLVLPATLVLAGIWPFGAIAGGPRYAPLGALLLIAVVLPMAGDGLEHWRSLYSGWLVLAASIVAVRPSWPKLMACGALFATACGSDFALWAGVSLSIIASLLWLRPALAGPWLRLAYLAAGVCGIVALGYTLANEVVYSVLMLAAVVLAVLRTRTGAPAAG